MSNVDLRGKRVLVVGGETALGRAVVIGLAEAGVDVAIVSLSPDTKAEFAINSALNELWALQRKGLALAIDATDGEQVRGAVERADQELGRLDRKHFCYRDFQTRNIMWHDDAPVFIDYQSGRHGPLAYDLAALLFSPDSGLDDPGRTILIGDYLDALSARGVLRSRDEFEQELYLAVTVRRLQALGAYARLAYGQGQTQYLEKIPPAWVALRSLLERNLICAARPALRKWLLTLASSGFTDRESGNQVLGSSPGE